MSNHKAERFIFEMEARYPDISFRSLKDESYVQSAWEYRSFTLFEYTNFKRDVETYACLKKYVNSDAHNFRCTPAALDIVRSLDINLSSLKDRGLMGPMQNILHALFGALVTMVMSFFFLAIIMGVISSCCYWIFKRFSRLYSVGMSKVDVKLKIRV